MRAERWKDEFEPELRIDVMPQLIVATFYKFVRISDPAAVRDAIRRSATEAGTRGTVLIAEEGINGTVSGRRDAIDRFLADIRSLPGCAGIRHRESSAEEDPFRRMKVRLKREIVTMRRPDVGAARGDGTADLSARLERGHRRRRRDRC